MYYPANYGFIPNTLSEDGDPCDAMVLSQVAVVPGAVIRCRPVGALLMEDEHGADEKILAVPVDELNPSYDGIEELTDVPEILREQIEHFCATTRSWRRTSGSSSPGGSIAARRES